MAEGLESHWGLPEEIVFCKRCLFSNQRPASSVEFRHDKEHKHRGLQIDEEGVCDPCRFEETKQQIDWKQREEELLQLLDK
ncbi:MAG TPA: N-acetyl sugar amidotransferase, partial [Dehalococcoidia bacterium]|nr:N-acetyl sugar amidotransferase [Dehalococcoidia bacterium]